MGGNYEKGLYNQLMEVMAALTQWKKIFIQRKSSIKMMLSV